MPKHDKLRQYDHEDIIRELCNANALCYEKVSRLGSTASALEMFFSGYPRMVGLQMFPRLTQLTVIAQNVEVIQGLEACPLLQELWVAECNVTKISGIQKCLQLEKLYLYDNKISKIGNLEMLEKLQVLWLNNNHIGFIEGLKTLQNLRELNLADNVIERIGHTLDPNVNLNKLNLSGNKIKSFKELTYLANLPKLRDLALKDPQSNPNPVCLLCNYTTHVLYHLPGLSRLDSYNVTSQQVKEKAESTVMKKIMYYHMRVKSTERHPSVAQEGLLELQKKEMELPEEHMKSLSFAIKHLEHKLLELQAKPRKSEWTTSEDCEQIHKEQKLLRKLEALRERLQLWSWRLEEIESYYKQERAQVTVKKQLWADFLLIELESVGNIHFEHGSSNDAWFTSCSDLLQSRFTVNDYQDLGITGVKVSDIIRVHNQALRLRFENKLQALLSKEEFVNFYQNHKQWLEYLFYVVQPEGANESSELLKILEDGFSVANIYKAVPLTNSLNLSDKHRLQHLDNKSAGSLDLTLLHGKVIVAKAFLGRSMPVQELDGIERDRYPKMHSVYHRVGTEGSSETCCSCSEGCLCQRQWFMFDKELVLPEFLISYEYITKDIPQGLPALPPSELVLDKEALNMEPVFQVQPKIQSLNEQIILTLAQGNMLSQISTLNLHGNSLSRLKEIGYMTSLRRLTISFNEFRNLDDVSDMPGLEFLDASFNKITTLEGMSGLDRLAHLDLSWNQLTQIWEEMAVLREHTPSLLRLDIHHNPWCRLENVRMIALGQLKCLTHLDEKLVTEEEAGAALELAANSRITKASLQAHGCTNKDRPRSLSLLSTAQLLTKQSPKYEDLTNDPEPGWTSRITALDLDGQGLSYLENLDQLVNLRWASFNNNNIKTVDGLVGCQHLEELSLDNNSISEIEGLSKLYNLIRLSLNNNKLTSLDVGILENFPNLHFLSVESNKIDTLQGVRHSHSLLELYIGNNCISCSREVYHLKALSYLIILDLYGNPLMYKQESYRSYVIFHLPFLKALDGEAVEAAETESARDIFGGRLTPDVVAEKVGHSNFRQISELQLQSSSIRMVDLAPVDLFHSLHRINLERNNLTSFSGLVYLPSVKQLNLNYNHIESIIPRPKLQGHNTFRNILYHKVNSSGYGQQSKGVREPGLVDSLDPLMGSLEVLHLSHNSISSLGNLQLSRLTSLKVLFLQGNELSQVEGLEGLRKLRKLALDGNRIRALGENSFSGQDALQDLRLSDNRLRELGHLRPLPCLRSLTLDNNKLQEVSEIVKLEVLPSLVELSVIGNPAARRCLHRSTLVMHLPQLLKLDGVDVTLEERAHTDPELIQYANIQFPDPAVLELDIDSPNTLPTVIPIPLPRGSCPKVLEQNLVLPGNQDDASNDTNKRPGAPGHPPQTGCSSRGSGSPPSTPSRFRIPDWQLEHNPSHHIWTTGHRVSLHPRLHPRSTGTQLEIRPQGNCKGCCTQCLCLREQNLQ